MKNIILVCVAGMSTSLMVNKMKNAAKEKNLDVHIEAMPVDTIASYTEDIDVLLLGPQVRYQYEELKKNYEPKGTKVAVIDMMDYGTMNGRKVLDAAYSLMD